MTSGEDRAFRCEACGHDMTHEEDPYADLRCPKCGGWVEDLGAARGRKDDTGKARLDLLPPELLFGVGEVLAFGAAKYEPRGWEKGIAYSRVFAALMRHMWAWWRGEDKDAETGLSHLWHAGCCISFLIAFEQRGIGPDDRPSRPRD